MFVRDFAYPIYNPLHFGHYQNLVLLNTPSENYAAKALYGYNASIDGELSLEEEEVLQVLKNLGNGWVTARKLSTNSVGIIPENYIQRLN